MSPFVSVTDDEVRVVHDPNWRSTGGWTLLFWGGASLVIVALDLADGTPGLRTWVLGMLGSMLILQSGRFFRPEPTRVTRDAITRGGYPRLPWSEVERVLRPTPGDGWAQVRLRSGRVETLAVPAQHAADVARLGSVPLG